MIVLDKVEIVARRHVHSACGLPVACRAQSLHHVRSRAQTPSPRRPTDSRWDPGRRGGQHMPYRAPSCRTALHSCSIAKVQRARELESNLLERSVRPFAEPPEPIDHAAQRLNSAGDVADLFSSVVEIVIERVHRKNYMQVALHLRAESCIH